MFILHEYVIFQNLQKTSSKLTGLGHEMVLSEPNVAQKQYMLYLALMLFDILRISRKKLFSQQRFLILKFIMNPAYKLFVWCS